MEWKIHAHDWAVHLLQGYAGGGNLRHAYLFTGLEGVGRQTLAIRFAQALLCTDPPESGLFCGVCRACSQLDALTYPDLSRLLPDEGHRDIRIDQVRALQHTLALAPYAGAYRIALLPNFQRATTQAANALLKTLEEPPDRVVLLLTASSPEGLLPTIVSRCEVIRLRPAPIASVEAYLQSEKGLTSEKARLLAHISGGRVGQAIRLADDPSALAVRQDHLLTLFELLPAQRTERFAVAERILKPRDKAREQLGEVLPIWLSFWRDVFLCTANGSATLVNTDLVAQIEQAASHIPGETARAMVIAHEQALKDLEANANVRLLLETLLLQWPPIPAAAHWQGIFEQDVPY
jgi:DNA polymerase III subunit delta'